MGAGEENGERDLLIETPYRCLELTNIALILALVAQ